LAASRCKSNCLLASQCEIVGAVVGQKTRWDPDLLRAYSVASWAWVGQYLLRMAVYGVLWLTGQTVARVALTWPLQAACLAVSWWLIRRPCRPTIRDSGIPGRPSSLSPKAILSRLAGWGNVGRSSSARSARR
jgi:hypothetical protein